MTLGVETRAAKAADALRSNNEQAVAVVKLLKDKGIKASDIQTTDLSTYPETTNEGRTITGYLAHNSVAVRIRKIDSAGEIIDAVAQAVGDAIRVHSLNFSIDDTGKLVKKGRALAIKAARAQAKQFSEAADVKLGKIRSLTEMSESPGSPEFFEDDCAGCARASLDSIKPGRQDYS